MNRRRRRTVKRLPKLSLAVATACHLILAARATTGAGGDQKFFEPLLLDAYRRATVKTAVADAGYDSEANHCISRAGPGHPINHPAQGGTAICQAADDTPPP